MEGVREEISAPTIPEIGHQACCDLGQVQANLRGTHAGWILWHKAERCFVDEYPPRVGEDGADGFVGSSYAHFVSGADVVCRWRYWGVDDRIRGWQNLLIQLHECARRE